MKPLPEDVVDSLARFVPRRDLERMRPLVGRPASWLPSLLGVSATAIGRFVVFRTGRYKPDTARGLALIAHEAVHVGQFRELKWWRFFPSYLLGRLQTGGKRANHPMEIPCNEAQRRVLQALRDEGWP